MSPQRFEDLPPRSLPVSQRFLMMFLAVLLSISCTSTGGSGVEESDGFVMAEVARCGNAKARIVVSGRFETQKGVVSLLGVQAAGRAERSLYSFKGDVTRVENSHRTKEVRAKGKRRFVKIHSFRVTLEEAELLGGFSDLTAKNIVLNIIEYGPERKKGNVRINFEPKEKAPYDWNFFISCKFPLEVQMLTAAAKMKAKDPSAPAPRSLAEPNSGVGAARAGGGTRTGDDAVLSAEGSEAEDRDESKSMQ